MKCSLLALGAVAFTTIFALPINPQGRAPDAPVSFAVGPPASTFKTSIIKTHPPASAPTEIVGREMDKGMLDKRENVRIATREMDKGMLDKRGDSRMQMKKKIGGFFKSCHQKLGSAMKMKRPAYPHSEAALADATGRVATINPRGVAGAPAHPKEEKDEPMGMKSARKVPFFKGATLHHDSKKEKYESMGMKSARKIPFFKGATPHHDSKKEKDESMGMKLPRKIPFFKGATPHHDSKEKDNGKTPRH